MDKIKFTKRETLSGEYKSVDYVINEYHIESIGCIHDMSYVDIRPEEIPNAVGQVYKAFPEHDPILLTEHIFGDYSYGDTYFDEDCDYDDDWQDILTHGINTIKQDYDLYDLSLYELGDL